MQSRLDRAGVLLLSCIAAATLTGCAVRSSRTASAGQVCPNSICPSFAALEGSSALRPGDPVRVLDGTGKRLTGRLLGLSATEVSVRVRDEQLRLAEADVLGIWRRASKGRSMAGYGAIGAVVGLGWGGVAWLNKRDIDCTREREDLLGDCYVHESYYFLAPTTALAFVGAGFGLVWPHELQVFAGVGRPIAAHIRPYVDRQRRGVELSVAF
jgi:hypothetical protein